ncbi:MAG: hypothetical protein U9O63_01745 [Actinomycetota bacterium]|nr:hypothetical protein [Actinomycetota bacterium]
MVFARTTLILAIALVAAACSSSEESPSSASADPDATTAEISNRGDEMEGHTPRGFPGTGTGLFTGDNLNSSFPDGDGVQIYLTFDLPEIQSVDAALLTSNVLHVSGTPFADLGELLAEPVEYDSFGPDLYDLPASGDPATCRREGEAGVVCDVTDQVDGAVSSGAASVQFRLRFERAGDNDGDQDLAMFFREDSNTNEPGLFTLRIRP